MDFQIIKDWNQLDLYASDWDLLIYQTDIIKNEAYLYNFIKTFVQHKEKDKGHPFCIIIKNEKEKVIHIVPLYYRYRIFFRYPIKLRTLTFFPMILSIRHSFILGSKQPDIDYLTLFKQIFDIFKKYKIDVLYLNGTLGASSEVLKSHLIDNHYQFKTLRKDKTLGKKTSDFNGFALPSSLTDLKAKLDKRFIKDYKRRLRNIEKIGSLKFVRYIKRNQELLTNENLECIYKEIELIEKNSWQNSEGAFNFTNLGKDFCLKILSSLSQEGNVDVLIMYVDDVPISYLLGSIINGQRNAYFTAYNKECKNFSPGTLVFMELLQDSIEHKDFEYINLAGASERDSYYKSLYCDIQDYTDEMLVWGKTFWGRLFNFIEVIKNNINLLRKRKSEFLFYVKRNLWIFFAEKIVINSINGNQCKFKCLIANNGESWKIGLNNFKKIKDNYGMLFIFPTERRVSFWMKQTSFSLDIIYFNEGKDIVKIYKNTEPFSQCKYDSIKSCKYALEVNAGIVEKKGIKLGDHLIIEK